MVPFTFRELTQSNGVELTSWERESAPSPSEMAGAMQVSIQFPIRLSASDTNVDVDIGGGQVLDFAESDDNLDFQILKCLEKKVGYIRNWKIRRNEKFLFASFMSTHDGLLQSFRVEEQYNNVYDAMKLQVDDIFSSLDSIGQIDLTVRLFSTFDMLYKHGERILWVILRKGDELQPGPFQSVAEPLMQRVLMKLEGFPRGYWQFAIAVTTLVCFHVAQASPIVAANSLRNFKSNAQRARNQHAEKHFADNLQSLVSRHNLDPAMSCTASDDCDCGNCQLYDAHKLAIAVRAGDDPHEYRRAEENLVTTLSKVRGCHDAKLKARETLSKVRKERIEFDRWLTCQQKVKEDQERCEREQRRREARATRERERQRKAREYEASKARELAISSAAARAAKGAVGAVLEAARRADRARASEAQTRLANLRAANAVLGQKDAAALQRTAERKKLSEVAVSSKPSPKPQTKPQVCSSTPCKPQPKPHVCSNTPSNPQDNTSKPQPKPQASPRPNTQVSQPSKPQSSPMPVSSAKTPQRIAEREAHKRRRRLLCAWAAALLTRIVRGFLARQEFKRMADAKFARDLEQAIQDSKTEAPTPPKAESSNPKTTKIPCRYGADCKYGQRCKFYHPVTFSAGATSALARQSAPVESPQSPLLECSVCLEAMTNPIAFNCGHIFCATCSEKATHSCFLCQQPITGRIRLFV